MSSAGTIASAIQSLKENRALLKRRKLKNIRDLVFATSGKTELEFKEISPKEMELIKSKIRKDAKRAAKVEAVIYFVSITITLSFFYWLIYS